MTRLLDRSLLALLALIAAGYVPVQTAASRHSRSLSAGSTDAGAAACLRRNFTNAERDKNVFSQAGEDGILEQIFDCIGTTNKYYVEFGVESGIQCSTRLLREHKGWSGLMMDGGYQNETIGLRKEFIYADNIVSLFNKYSVPMQFDQLTVDIDLNTFYVLREILAAGYQPRSLTVEINRNFGPEDSYTAVYLPKNMWLIEQEGTSGTCYFGASLKAYERLVAAYGYTLVALDTIGVNAFFIHESAASGQEVFSHEQVLNNTRYNQLWDALHGYCHNSLWLRIGENVDFQDSKWKQCLVPVMLSHQRQPEAPNRRSFHEMDLSEAALPIALRRGRAVHAEACAGQNWPATGTLQLTVLLLCLLGCGAMAQVMRVRRQHGNVGGALK